MKKIPSLFERPENDIHGICINKVTPGCEWVINGEGLPTHKLDGSACAVIEGKLYKRYDNSRRQGEVRVQKTTPLKDWIHCGDTSERGQNIYWIPVTSKDYYHQIAWGWAQATLADGTYELVGPEVQDNPHQFIHNTLIPHVNPLMPFIHENPRTYDSIKSFLETSPYEGIVWHHPDGRMCKITKRKFGLEWNGKKSENY